MSVTRDIENRRLSSFVHVNFFHGQILINYLTYAFEFKVETLPESLARLIPHNALTNRPDWVFADQSALLSFVRHAIALGLMKHTPGNDEIPQPDSSHQVTAPLVGG